MLTEQSLILASTCSRYFAWLLEQPGFRSIFLKNGDYPLGEDFFSDWLTRINKKDEFMVMQELRRLRKTVLGHLVLRDINGLADLDEVMHTMTFLAETALQIAVQCASIQLSERYGDPIGHESQSSQTLIVVGMGKLGGRELNVSSDIDLIFTYPEEGETNGEKTISCKEF
ncbi:MAG: bifunctional glutamine synthetase adenylyltransferase/deadenyltransferase, partial [Pseudomonadota bacterium]|nr:bifunctional glutamine synthetase adenylyltransferase/deadenyltransferase [Pseudomonadota bacterium]